MEEKALRSHLGRLLDWGDAHTTFERAFEGVPEEVRGVRPEGCPHSLWELLEHLRFTQRDILDFCRDSDYRQPAWPGDYWPGSPAPESEEAWTEAVQGYLLDRADLVRIATDPDVDLFAEIPHGTGQTYLREVLLAADHGSYHLGQVVLVRRLLGAWESEDGASGENPG